MSRFLPMSDSSIHSSSIVLLFLQCLLIFLSQAMKITLIITVLFLPLLSNAFSVYYFFLVILL